MQADEFAERLPDARRQPSGHFSARCPAHDDRNPSLSFKDGEKGVVVRCHGGCDLEAITNAVGLRPRDLFEPDAEGEATVTPLRRTLVAEYHYTDTKGEVLYTIQRFEPKGFAGKLPPAEQRVLYNLPRVKAQRDAGGLIYVTEGEKDAESLTALGLVATTGCGGVGKWLPQYTQQLTGVARVIVLADDDTAGRPHAQSVAAALEGRVGSVEVKLPAAGCKDITDHLQAGYTLGSLRPMPMGEDQLGLVHLDQVTMAPATWAWDRHMALGALTYVEGDPGVSKSTVSCDLAARWSRGDVMPDGSANPFSKPVVVLMVTAEDSIESTMTPRLFAAGADLRYVKAVVSASPDSAEPFNLDEHVDRLRHDVRRLDAKVVFIDPLSAFLGAKAGDGFKDIQVRAALLPLSKMAEELGVAVIVVRHFNKGPGGKAIHKGGGSIGFIGAARGAFQISHHPEEPDTCIFTNAKNNLAKLQVSLTYRLVQDERIRKVNPEFDIARVEWLGVSDLDAQSVLDAVPGESGQIKDYGLAMLAAVDDGPKAWTTISEILAKDGYNGRSLERYRGRYLEAIRIPGEGNRGTLWRAKGSTYTVADASPQGTTQPLHTPESAPDLPTSPHTQDSRDGGPEEARCEVCRGRPALYWAAPISDYRCRAHAPEAQS